MVDSLLFHAVARAAALPGPLGQMFGAVADRLADRILEPALAEALETLLVSGEGGFGDGLDAFSRWGAGPNGHGGNLEEEGKDG